MRAALSQAGLTLDERNVRYGPIDLAAAAEMMQQILEAQNRPSAVVCTNDVFAVGAMMASRSAGVAIPDEISITGVDNTDLGATQTPGLTSIRTPIVEVGRAAAEQMVARLEGKPHSSFATLPFELVFRGSTGPARV